MNPNDNAAFWKIIDTAATAGPLSGTRQRAIAAALETATAVELDAFNVTLWGWFSALGLPELRVAAERLMGECSEGAFNDFRCWLILQGQEKVERVVSTPDVLGTWRYDETPRTQGLLTIGLRIRTTNFGPPNWESDPFGPRESRP